MAGLGEHGGPDEWLTGGQRQHLANGAVSGQTGHLHDGGQRNQLPWTQSIREEGIKGRKSARLD